MISFIIPTLNEEKIIGQTVRQFTAYASQHEVIVSDGGSRDATSKIAESAGARVVRHTREERQTIAAGRNAGATGAQGEFLVFIDADVSIPHPDAFFKKTLADFHADPKLFGLTVFVNVLPELETLSDKIFFGFFNYLYVVLNNVFHVGGSPGEFQMIRADAFRELHGFNELLVTGEDHDMFRRLARIGRTRFETTLTVYHPGRRPHAIGWPKLLWIYTTNTLATLFFKKALVKTWEEIR